MTLRETVRAHAENRPGVYRMLGPDDEVLYVGKSVRVRTRLLSYFQNGRTRKAATIISHTQRIEWEYLPNEFAALLHELKRIKQWRPRFNRAHRRDRRYCFIKITREAAGRLRVVSRVRDDGARYYGPFRGRRRVREALREVIDLLELRDCAASTPMRFADQLDIFERDLAPLCHRADLERCMAPCAGGCTESEYDRSLEIARAFLEGDADRPLAILRRRMRNAAERLQFEYAADLRDRARRLEEVRDGLVELAHTLAELTFVYAPPGHEGEDWHYVIHHGTVRDAFPAPRPAERGGSARRVRDILDEPRPTLRIVDAYRVAEMLLVARWFRRNPEERENTIPADEFIEARRPA